MELWPHQKKAIEEIAELMNRGCKRILVTSPTGGGKSLIMEKLLEWGFPAVLYANRKMLIEQLAGRLEAAGFSFGIRAASHKPKLLEDIQLSSMATENQRVYVKKKWQLHDASLVLIDEAHIQAARTAMRITSDHFDAGATLVGFTATPLDLGHMYDELVVAGTNSQLRDCGALVPARTYAPDEPDPKKIEENSSDGVLSEKQVKKVMRPNALFGRVIEHWRRLNPDARPTLLFAPGVQESQYFAEQFQAAGVPAAHIDGDNVWIRGQWYDPSPEVRSMLRKEAESGRVKVVCNRFVLREGIDWPFLYHGIFATAFASLQSYLQSGGRLLRAHKSLDHVVIQDHGANWWRHGSLNSDREWELGDTARIVASERASRMREGKEPEPIRCPKCNALRLWGKRCEECGHETRVRARVVVQSDGTLKEVTGDIFAPRNRRNLPHFVQLWESMYWRAFNSRNGMTFAQAEALFAGENNWIWPPRDLPLMPTNDKDWYRRVADVPMHALTSVPERAEPKRQTRVDELDEVLA